MATIFVSPGVFTKEQDFTVFASRIGITRLGLVGKTLKGPAFKPTKVRTTDDYLLRFGSTNPDYPLPYVANSFLSQSNELNVTRILGSKGFDNSPAWYIVSDDAVTYTGDVVGTSGTSFSATTFTVKGAASSGDTFDVITTSTTGMTDGAISASTSGNNITIHYNNTSGGLTMENWYNVAKTHLSDLWISVDGILNSAVLSDDSVTITASALEDKGSKAGSILAVLRSKRDEENDKWFFENETDVEIDVKNTSALGAFGISGFTGPFSATSFTASLDESSEDYIVKIFGKNPARTPGTPNLYVEKIYPNFVREADSRGDVSGIRAKLVYSAGTEVTNFKTGYSNSVTPWIVSRVIGGDVRDLFRVQTISDGDASAKEIKISIANIDINNYTFDVIVRRFEDTDATAASTQLERWSNLSFREEDSNFIGKVIGTTDEDYPIRSNFITIDLAPSIPRDTVPAGFRGYKLRNLDDAKSPDIYYKTGYTQDDSTFKTYLGVSELGYENFTINNQASNKTTIKSIESDLFVFDGASDMSGLTKGFHLENIANSSEFVSGDKPSISDYKNAGGLLDRGKLKFTLVPTGGFDGWNKYKQYNELHEEFGGVNTDNIDDFKKGLNQIANPEIVDINVLATPGVDFHHNTNIIKYALDIAESRTDIIYVMDSPRTNDNLGGGAQQLVANLEATGIDSNYAATYWPWVQIEDVNSGRYTYQAPTLMAVQSFALTDNVSAPWFAPAGLNRGMAGAQINRADVRLDNSERDILYAGRINPIATFVQQGVVIWGQKTLQYRQSALDRINIRRLLLQVRRLVSAASLTLLFEQNDQTLRDQFLAKVEPLLLQIQNQRGLTAFKVVMDSSNNTSETIDRNILVGKIQLQPTKTAEFIDLTFQVLPTGSRFEDF